MLDLIPQHHHRHQTRYKGGRNQRWKCSYCRKVGHLKPYCYKLYGYLKYVPKSRRRRSVNKQKGWIPKNGMSKEVNHISLKASAREAWYLIMVVLDT